jgi:hypothetical protein
VSATADGSDTESRKKFIQARPASGGPSALPAREANEEQAEMRYGEIEDIDHISGILFMFAAVAGGG